MKNLKQGKNYKVINEFGISYDLVTPSGQPLKIYHYHDLSVEGRKTSDYWLVMEDLDGEAFATPISGAVLAQKLLSSAFTLV